MGIFEFLLIILIVAALLGRGTLALGMIFDFLIALLVLGLLIRLFYVIF